MCWSSLRFVGLFVLLVAGPTLSAKAQNWPTRTVKFIVPFGPGAGADIGARLFAEKLQAKWGQPVVVENRPGGDSMVAIQAFLGANDDHVLMFGPSGGFIVHPLLYTKLPYNPADLIPIARVSTTILAVAVKKDAPYNNLKEFTQAARAAPGTFSSGLVQGITELTFWGYQHHPGRPVRHQVHVGAAQRKDCGGCPRGRCRRPHRRAAGSDRADHQSRRTERVCERDRRTARQFCSSGQGCRLQTEELRRGRAAFADGHARTAN